MINLSNNDLTTKLQYIFKYSIENGVLPILWIDENGLIIYHNKILSVFTSEDNLINKYIYRVASDIKKEDWENLWDKLNEIGNHKFIYEFYNKKLDKIYTFNIFTTKVTYDNIPYCHMVVIDITELVEINNKLCKEKLRAEESERLKNVILI